MNFKKCSKCHNLKPLDDFYKSNGKHLFGVSAWCKSCHCQNGKAVHENAGRNRYYIKEYGITEKDYNHLYDSQNGKCAICEKRQKRFFVDHDHKNKRVRGLLCSKCNFGLGFFLDNANLLERAIEYLKKL